MKKVLLLILLLGSTFSKVLAQYTTTDYMYTEGLKSEAGKLCFDVLMKGGKTYYTAFQTEIQMPSGLKITSKRGGSPNIDLLKDTDTFNDDEGFTEHSISTNFPESGNQTYVKIGCSSSGNYNMAQTSGPLFRVYVEKDESAITWPLGAIRYFGAKFITDEAIGYAISDREDILVLKEDASLTLNVSSAAHWSTCILPFSADIPDGVKAYTCMKNDETYIYLTEAESFEAYTPYILYSENGYSGAINGTVSETIPAVAETGVVKSGYLNGAIVPQTATEGYVLQKQDEDVKFYAIADGDSFAIPAGKCWMTLPEGAKANALSFKLEDATGMTTAIIPVSTITFDLFGRQTANDKGLLIRDGKKTIKY